jgi:peptide-methionine (S)-S-oxide reductase
MSASHETAIFGAGCFWGVEQAFRQVDGVIETSVGYAGGRTDNPSYRDVCTGTTGHAEVVQVVFDSNRISYEDLLEVFWSVHDPTQVNRQGPDVGSQYRSIILTTSAEQERTARGAKASIEARRTFPSPVATEIVEAGRFWRAEEYHQRYLEKRNIAACHTR